MTTDADLLGRFVPDAAERLHAYGSFAAAVAADPQLHFVRELAARFVLDEPAREMITSWSTLKDYLKVRLGGEPREQFRALFLDNRNALIQDELMGTGTVDHAPVYPREIMTRALLLGAKSIILVHNHPSGDPTPSRADISVTQEIIEAGRGLGITIHDHVVVGRAEPYSFRTNGLIG